MRRHAPRVAEGHRLPFERGPMYNNACALLAWAPKLLSDSVSPESDLRDWKNAGNAGLFDSVDRNALSRRFLLGILLELDKGIGYLSAGGKREALSARHDLIEHRDKERPDLRLLGLR